MGALLKTDVVWVHVIMVSAHGCSGGDDVWVELVIWFLGNYQVFTCMNPTIEDDHLNCVYIRIPCLLNHPLCRILEA